MFSRVIPGTLSIRQEVGGMGVEAERVYLNTAHMICDYYGTNYDHASRGTTIKESRGIMSSIVEFRRFSQ